MLIFLKEVGGETEKELELFLNKNGFWRRLPDRIIYVEKGDEETLSLFPCVEKVVSEHDKNILSGKTLHPDKTVVKVGEKRIGDGFCLIAGPCAVESYDRLLSVAQSVKKAGAEFLRGGAFKPRTSPYTFQGLGEEGLSVLAAVRQKTGLATVSEIVAEKYLPLYKDVDVLQVGARNMQNFDLLKALGRQEKPVLLKRGIAATLDEWLFSAEYIMAEGNPNVILCERGTRYSGEKSYRLNIGDIKVLQSRTHLPVIVDPSHVSQSFTEVMPHATDAAKSGACGLIVEVNVDRDGALCDGKHSLTPEEFFSLAKACRV